MKALPIKYQFKHLSKNEREGNEELLLIEMDYQSWFAVTFIPIFGQDVFFPIQ